MLKSINEDLVVEHRFIISFFFLFHLLHEELLLDEWVIELGVCVTKLMVFDEELESLSQSGLGSMVFG